MNFYAFEDIREACNLIEVATKVLGLTVNGNGRGPATWRGGDNPNSVSYDNEKGWFDHVENEGGDVIKLVAMVKFAGDAQQAQEFLGDFLGLTPKMGLAASLPGQSFYEKMIADGYRETARYTYTDEVGNAAHCVARLEHPEKKKVFCQGANGRWGTKGIKLYPYNLPAVISSPYAIICEGEKAAHALLERGQVATTNAMGAGSWQVDYNQYFKDKDVFIMPDNDKAGQEHARMVAKSLLGIAKSIKIVPTSKVPRGDVYDYLEDGHTIDDLVALANACPFVKPEDLADVDDIKEDPDDVKTAKNANRYEFRNFWPVQEQQGTKTITRKDPVHINRLIEECHKRFLGFPRKVGEQLFDHDKTTHELFYISKQTTLFSWIARKSKQRVDWSKGDNLVSKEEFFEGIHAEAIRYQSVSMVPDWPRRDDVYYAHKPIPQADPNHQYFERFVNFFNPLSSPFRTALKALIIAPLFYRPGIPRPLWVIDSVVPGSGKTTLANLISILYGRPPIEVKKNKFKQDMESVNKRLVSSEGRLSRVFLVDNVTGTFASDELSGLITMPYISGIAPYGRGETTRPNNLTYIITANDATIDNDLAIRAFFVMLDKIGYSNTWNQDVQEFIAKYRLNVFADILDILNSHRQDRFDAVPVTRYPEFETQILQAVCTDFEEYNEVVKVMLQSRQEANIEDEWGKELEDMFKYEIKDLGRDPDQFTFWIRSTVAAEWFARAFPEKRCNAMQFIRNLAKTGHMPRLDTSWTTYPHNGPDQRRGVLWVNQDGKKEVDFIIAKDGRRTVALTV